jgi:hypothetical protein
VCDRLEWSVRKLIGHVHTITNADSDAPLTAPRRFYHDLRLTTITAPRHVGGLGAFPPHARGIALTLAWIELLTNPLYPLPPALAAHSNAICAPLIASSTYTAFSAARPTPKPTPRNFLIFLQHKTPPIDLLLPHTFSNPPSRASGLHSTALMAWCTKGCSASCIKRCDVLNGLLPFPSCAPGADAPTGVRRTCSSQAARAPPLPPTPGLHLSFSALQSFATC